MSDGPLEVCFRFIRDGEVPTQDDIVTISPKGPNFAVTSKIVNDSSSNKRNWCQSILSKHGTIRFVDDMMRLACLDSLPFQNVQMDIPCSPSFCFDVADGRLLDAREIMLRLLETCLSSWPEVVTENEPRKRKRTGSLS